MKTSWKKLRHGDIITIPSQELQITIVAPTQVEIEEHKQQIAEKARVAAIVKKNEPRYNKRTKRQQTKRK